MIDDPEGRNFDLNIEKVLEGWEACHAIREVIANALDEQALTQTADVQISRTPDGAWHIRDFGRGLKYEHLTQNENEEKLKNPSKVVGKFGVGLKDALATFSRRDVDIRIRSRYGDITLGQIPKSGFTDVVTLHAIVHPAQDSSMLGTDVILRGITDDEIAKAKGFFLKFSGESVLDDTPYGQILQRNPVRNARIYITGMLVAEEENFAFSFNITSLTAAMRKALNRERTNVGRSVYLCCKRSSAVSGFLVKPLRFCPPENKKVPSPLNWSFLRGGRYRATSTITSYPRWGHPSQYPRQHRPGRRAVDVLRRGDACIRPSRRRSALLSDVHGAVGLPRHLPGHGDCPKLWRLQAERPAKRGEVPKAGSRRLLCSAARPWSDSDDRQGDGDGPGTVATRFFSQRGRRGIGHQVRYAP